MTQRCPSLHHSLLPHWPHYLIILSPFRWPLSTDAETLGPLGSSLNQDCSSYFNRRDKASRGKNNFSKWDLDSPLCPKRPAFFLHPTPHTSSLRRQSRDQLAKGECRPPHTGLPVDTLLEQLALMGNAVSQAFSRGNCESKRLPVMQS